MKYIDILSDKKIQEQYKIIDGQNKYPFNHGLKHVSNTCKIMEKLTSSLGIDGIERESLLIACALHDIGQTNGRENHGLKARIFSEEYLKKSGIPLEYLEKIYIAIENHNKKENLEELSLFENLVCFVDKMDFTRDRLESNYKERFGNVVYENIISVDFEYNPHIFILNITSDGTITEEDLLNDEKFFFKVILATRCLSIKLGCQFKICLDGLVMQIDKCKK